MELELSGPKLKVALEALVTRAEEQGGVEAYVEALRLKSALFRDALAGDLQLEDFRALCAHMPTVRRRVGAHAEAEGFARLKPWVDALLSSGDLSAFCARFPDDRAHRWVRDLAAELLHHADPERHPLMTRWVWDARTNTGVLREIWHAEDVDAITIGVPDDRDTFIQLRQELAQYLQANGVFRDVLFFVDLLCAQVYAEYIGERAGMYLRTDFATPEDPMLHARRILGLDGVQRLKAAA